ncbi:MAG TPA: flagellar hook-length control protein FliK [Thermoleophilaceae bacterium]
MRVFLDPALLKAELPQLVLRPGMTLAARVAERQGSRGLLMIAGSALAAELPENVKAGETLRLRVQEASSERIVMRLEGESQQVQEPLVVPVPLPGGQQAFIQVDEREGQGGQGAGGGGRVAITYRSPALGALDFRLALEGGGLSAHVQAAQGAPHELASAQAEELRDALNRATGKPVQLTVSPRHDPLDVYA